MRPLRSTTPPSCLAWPARADGFELQICPGSRWAPGSTNSSPVARIATVGRSEHSAAERPRLASTPRAAGRSTSPAAITEAPAATSSPRRLMLAPGFEGDTVTIPPSSSVRSTGTTASVPAGTGAPVEIRTAVPGASVVEAGAPARASSITSRAPSALGGTAKPSIAELSKGGTSTGLRTSSRSTRPSAASSGTLSPPRVRATVSTRRRASPIPINSATRAMFSPRRGCGRSGPAS